MQDWGTSTDKRGMVLVNGERGGPNGSAREPDPRDARIEYLEHENAKLIEERDHWKHHSEHLEKQLDAARPASDRRPPSPRTGRKDAAGVRAGGPAPITARMAAGGGRHGLTRRMRRRFRRRVRTAAARSR